MNDLLRWFGGRDVVPGSPADVRWAWVTVGLSLAVAGGYAAIAFNRYFQSRVGRRADSRAAAGRLRHIVLWAVVCGALFYAADMPWPVWRAYDATLALLAAYAWGFAVRMRGLSLVDARLAEVAELEQSARRYREIAELLPQMVWTATAEGRVDFCNRRWVDYVGGGRTWLDAVHPDDRPRVAGWWEAAVAARTPATTEARLGGGRGYRTFVVSATPVIRGDAVKWLGACADVEDQKLLAAEREAQARRRVFFLNALSHDLRAPLNNLVLTAHLLKVSPAEEAGACADAILENATAAADLVTNLLDFARAGAEDRPAVEDVSLSAVLEHVVRRFRPAAERKGLTLRVDGKNAGVGDGGGDVVISSDRQKVERLVGNLVDNAIKYTERGGVRLDFALGGSPSGGTPAGGGEGVAVRVTDTGIGVPPANVPYLFDEFYQVNNYERDRRKGFGLGLAICKCLADQLGGRVRLAGTGEGGSCFEVALPGVRPRRRGRPDGPAGVGAATPTPGLCRV